jgi:RNA polymerase sigma-70 factor (ECF subfamily)
MACAHENDHERKRQLLGQALEEQNERLHRTIQVYLRRFGLGDGHDAAGLEAGDVLHETVIAAYTSLERYDPDRPAYSWLCGIALNIIRDQRRKQQRERLVVLPVADTPQVRAASRQLDGTALSEDEMFDLLYRPGPDSSPTRLRLFELLSLVPEDDRQLLAWHFEEGTEDDELAARLGVSRGAVRVRRCRALRRLREAYTQSEHTELEGKQDA